MSGFTKDQNHALVKTVFRVYLGLQSSLFQTKIRLYTGPKSILLSTNGKLCWVSDSNLLGTKVKVCSGPEFFSGPDFFSGPVQTLLKTGVYLAFKLYWGPQSSLPVGCSHTHWGPDWGFFQDQSQALLRIRSRLYWGPASGFTVDHSQTLLGTTSELQ